MREKIQHFFHSETPQLLVFPIAVVLITKLLLLVGVGWLSVLVYPHSRFLQIPFLETWNIWDANTYLLIAQHGYQTVGDAATFIAFLPLLPLLISIASKILFVNFLTAGFIVATIDSFLAAIMFYNLALLDVSKSSAKRALVLLFIYPTAIFLNLTYTESLFIFLACTSFYLLRKERYWWAFVVAAFATATRLPGVVLIPAFLVELWFYHREKIRRQWWIWIAAIIIPAIGFLIYLVINKHIYGNWLQFSVVLKTNWYASFSPTLSGFTGAIGSISWRTGVAKISLGYMQLGFALFAWLSAIWVAVKLRKSYAVFMILALYETTASTFWSSIPRYTVVLFPMFLMLGMLTKQRFVFYSFVTIFIVLLIFVTLIDSQFGPIY